MIVLYTWIFCWFFGVFGDAGLQTPLTSSRCLHCKFSGHIFLENRLVVSSISNILAQRGSSFFPPKGEHQKRLKPHWKIMAPEVFEITWKQSVNIFAPESRSNCVGSAVVFKGHKVGIHILRQVDNIFPKLLRFKPKHLHSLKREERYSLSDYLGKKPFQSQRRYFPIMWNCRFLPPRHPETHPPHRLRCRSQICQLVRSELVRCLAIRPDFLPGFFTSSLKEKGGEFEL